MLLQVDLVEAFKKAGLSRTYNEGETVFLNGEPATGMYLIVKGTAKVLVRRSGGETEEVAAVREGETTGEISLLLNTPHTATVVAKTTLEIVLLTRNRLDQLKREQPELALRLYEMLAQTLARHLYERPW